MICISEADQGQIQELINKYDHSQNGTLEFNEFLGFMKEGLQYEESPNRAIQMRFLFDGMDVNGSHSLDREEIINCLSKWRDGDFKYITKMIFRGADKNKSKKVEISELKLACDNLGKGFSPEDFATICELEFGKKKKELEYWEFYKVITGETIDKKSKEADPYDGKLNNSKCCIII